MEGDGKVSYRRYCLVIRAIPGGWGVWIEDPAGHVADVALQEQLAADPWPTPAEARGAAEQFVDNLLGEESSY